MSRQPRLLIVEDESAIRMGLTYTLQPLGLQILEANNGVEALKILTTENVDLILTDLAMPEMNGLEFLRRLKLSGKKFSVLVMTAHADKIIAEQVKQLGVLGLVDKPWDDNYLIEVVQAGLAKISSGAA